MKPQDMFRQIVGISADCDQLGDRTWQYYGCSKFNGDTVMIDVDAGIVRVYDKSAPYDVNDNIVAKAEFAIAVSLQPISTENDVVPS